MYARQDPCPPYNSTMAGGSDPPRFFQQVSRLANTTNPQIKRILTKFGEKQIMQLKIGSPLQYSGLLIILLFLSGWAYQVNDPANDLNKPPGVILAYRSADQGIYLGSPNIVVLPDGNYVATFQDYGIGAAGRQHTYIFRSEDKGQNWRQVYTFEQTIYGRLFMHRGKLYYSGTRLPQRQIVLMRSDNGGVSWTQAVDATSGVILAKEGWRLHTVPSPVVEHNGRIWMAVGDNDGPRGGVGRNSRIILLSAPANKNLLQAGNWQYSEPLASEADWLAKGPYAGWMEGNALITPDGKPAILARVLEPKLGGQAALINYDKEGQATAFDPDKDMIDLPGGDKMFCIRYDAKSKRYWALTNPYFKKDRALTKKAERTLNMVGLLYSEDLRNWTIKEVLLFTDEIRTQGFMDMGWTFDGDDILALVGTAWADEQGGAEGPHRANFMTFHRFENFRKR